MADVDRLMVSVSGVRGIVGKTLKPEIAYDFGRAFGTMLTATDGPHRLADSAPAPDGEVFTTPRPTVALGRDTRPHGSLIKNAVAAGLMSCGVDVITLGVVTTPGAALMTRVLECAGGVIITASHNPPPYNGIKFLQPSGVGLTADQAGELERTWESGEFNTQEGTAVGKETECTRTHTMHIRGVKSIADVTGIASQRFRVVVDSINGAGCVVTPQLLGELGCEVVHLNSEPTGEFAHEPEPVEPNLTGLCEAVREHRAAVGFAQDPDADRLVVVDEKGTFIGEEYTLALCAAFVLRHRKGKLATNLATSRMIDDIAAKAGVEVLRSPTGEANVVELLKRETCIFGGEGNGGVIEPRVVPVRDSLVGMAMILQYMTDIGKPLSELVAEIPSYTLVKTKLPCPAGAADTVADRTRAMFQDEPGATFNDADGLRIDLPDSWLCVRASNTEPIMRIFAEAPRAAQAEALVDRVRAIAAEVIDAA
ncbi:MAG: phosphoglucosamine mutase [Planctomycetes bacterium]|jgi:phosphomannomutase|nr:phosphoglucosamine mutase [Planctomycetota bacterium]